MKVSFKEVISSEAYQKNAQIYVKAMIFVSAITLLITYFARDDASFIGTIILIFGWSLFGVSLLLAMPFYMVYVWLVVKMTSSVAFPSAKPTNKKGEFWRMIASVWNGITYIANITITIFIADLYWG